MPGYNYSGNLELATISPEQAIIKGLTQGESVIYWMGADINGTAIKGDINVSCPVLCKKKGALEVEKGELKKVIGIGTELRWNGQANGLIHLTVYVPQGVAVDLIKNRTTAKEFSFTKFNVTAAQAVLDQTEDKMWWVETMTTSTKADKAGLNVVWQGPPGCKLEVNEHAQETISGLGAFTMVRIVVAPSQGKKGMTIDVTSTADPSGTLVRPLPFGASTS